MVDYLSGAKTLVEIIVAVKENFVPSKSGEQYDFDALVEPIYRGLKPVVDDYLAMFRAGMKEANRLAISRDKEAAADLQAFADDVMAAREKLLTDRILIRQEAAALAAVAKDNRVRVFLEQASTIFDAPQTSEIRIEPRPGTSMAEFASKAVQDFSLEKNGPGYVVSILMFNYRATEQRWAALSAKYAEMRAPLVSKRPGLFRN